MAIHFTLNGQDKRLELEPAMPLLWVLRDVLGLTGTKYGCGIAACGACTVQVNGQALRSCVLPVSAVNGADVRTVEGLADQANQALHPLQAAWVEHQVPQCGYCQSGMLLAIAALLENHPEPSEDEINQFITNICRCGSYEAIRRAVRAVITNAADSDAAAPKASMNTPASKRDARHA